jgi:RNase P/RNase MRP subunit POP5
MTGTRNNSKNVSKNASGAKINAAISRKNKQIIIDKQKVLLPTLREQQRYAVYKLTFDDAKISSKTLDFNAVHNNIILQCNNMLGVFDGGKAGLMSAKYNPEKMKGIIRVNNVYVDKLKVCFGLIKTVNVLNNVPNIVNINNINNTKVIVDCVYVSGMLNKAIEKMDS